MKRRIIDLLHGHRLLFRFLFHDGWNLFSAVASAWDRPRKIVVAGAPVTQFVFNRDVVDGYNQRYDKLKDQLRTVVHRRGRFESAYLVPLVAIRLLTVIAAAASGFLATCLVSLVQFVVAPYSFFAAFAAWLMVVPFYVIHFASFAVLQLATGAIFSTYPVLGSYLKVPITPLLIAGWIVVDQLICLSLCVWTPLGRPVRYSFRRTLQSVGYGFINSKTYWLVLLVSLQGFQIDLLALTIHAMIPFHRIMRVARVLKPILPPFSLHHTFPSAMFYHYHRMVHLPGAYNEGHRHHHYLQDSTPFDADQYGSGMAEEWFKLMTEISVCLLTGLMPWSFAFSTLKQSFANKVGHTRIDGLHPMYDNFHVNHHVKHFKNFGYAGLPLDLLMGTECGDVSRLDNMGDKVRCTKHTESQQYVLAMRFAGGDIEIEEYKF